MATPTRKAEVMTAEAPARAVPPAAVPRHTRPAPLHSERASAGLALRQIWFGGLLVAAWTGILLWFGAVGFDKAHKLAGGVSLASLADNPAFRAIYGLPTAVDTLGGFMVWRVQILITIVGAIWVTLATSGVLRGNEEAGRFDLMLAAPLSLARATGSSLIAVLAAPLLAVVVTASALQAAGAPAGGSWLYGAGIGLLLATFAAVAAFTSQLVPERRRAGGLAAAVVLVMLVLRMVADGYKGAGWVRWTTPFGWVENLHAFGGNDLLPLVPLIVAPLALAALALWLARQRDTGAGLVRAADTAPRASTRMLAGPLTFLTGRRLRGVIGWALAVAVVGVFSGALADSFTGFASSSQYVQELEKFGMGAAVTPRGFLAIMDAILAVVMAGYAITCIHGDYDDEVTTRLDMPYSNKVTRTRWAGSSLLTMAAGLVLLTVVIALTTWAGSAITGAGLSAADCFEGAANVLPVAVLFLGFAMLLHGVWPSWTAGLVGGLVIVLYMVSLIGPGLSWPKWLVDLSPYHHLALVPAQSPGWTALGVMLGIAAAAAAAGLIGYARRDLR